MARIATSTLRNWLAAAVVGAGALATGCTLQTYKIDAIKSADVGASGGAFVMVNGNPERDDTDALVKKAAAYVKTALSSKGMYEAPDKVPPNITVEVDFGGEAPRREVVHFDEPVSRRVREPGTYVTETYVDEKGNTRTITRYIPGAEYEVFEGWRERTVTITVYPKYLRITAREVPPEGDDRPPRELWSVYVTNEDQDGNLEKSLPLLVAAAMDSIDQNTSSERTIRMGEGDERVTFIKRGMD